MIRHRVARADFDILGSTGAAQASYCVGGPVYFNMIRHPASEIRPCATSRAESRTINISRGYCIFSTRPAFDSNGAASLR